MTGFVRSNRGEMSLAGVRMSGRAWGPARRARAGLRRTFQSLELFEDISVGENLHAGAAEHTRFSALRDLFWPAPPAPPAGGREQRAGVRAAGRPRSPPE